MIGISSSSAGVLLLPKLEIDEYAVFDVAGGQEKNPIEAQYLYSAAQDWREIEGSDASDLLEQATYDYWLDRTVSLLRLVIAGLESSLERRVLEHVEELIGLRVSSEQVLSRLLVAPLANEYASVAPAQSALRYGFAAVAHILNELAGLQPLIRRLTDLWLQLPESAFSNFSVSRQVVWATVVENGEMQQLLTVATRRDFTARWNLLAFHFDTAQHRLGVNTLGQELSCRLFPQEAQSERMAPIVPNVCRLPSRDEEKQVPPSVSFGRVEKQISAIAQAVAEGRDAKAEKFLIELIQEQTSWQGGKSYAVKSLCNIAQRCADMFRTDFEAICLKEAMRLNSQDTWTLVQYANYLKRIGKYQEALEVCSQARRFEESVVVMSSTADVYSQQGCYEKAIGIYKTIPNWHENMVVLTGIADNLRKMGRMREAQAAYEELIISEHALPEFAGQVYRAQAGIAEIAKREGRLEEALRMYYRILDRRDLNDRDKPFYKLGLCNVLKLMEKFEDAFAVAAEVVQDYPFAMEARFTRGSILGLIGKELEGLKDLPEGSGSLSWREWLRPYYRGLLLLKLERFVDAKKNLVEKLSEAIVSGEEKAILRMASALWFLHEDEIVKVNEILSEIPSLTDCHAQYLSLVLKLHSATRQEDLSKMRSIKEQIDGLNVVDTILKKAVVALHEREFSLALICETDALLKQAA